MLRCYVIVSITYEETNILRLTDREERFFCYGVLVIIYARIVAVPVNFPAELEIRYEALNRETREPTAVFGSPSGAPRHFSWGELKRKFSIGEVRASECEKQLRQGEHALIAEAQEWEGLWGAHSISRVSYVRRRH